MVRYTDMASVSIGRGNVHSGRFEHGKRSGYGTLIKYSTNRIYEGYWKDNTIRENAIVRSRTLFGDHTEPEYIGTMKNMTYHGKGTMYWPDTGIRFEAMWENGKPIGAIKEDNMKKEKEEEEDHYGHENENGKGIFVIPVVRRVTGRIEDYDTIISGTTKETNENELVRVS